jgi:hypothetical protein
LLGFAFDDGVSESIALAAVNGILDRGDLGAKQAMEVDVKAPWEELLGDVMQITRAQHEVPRTLPTLRTAPAHVEPAIRVRSSTAR